MKKYTLLTGATGFIGQYVLERLLVLDVPVVTIGRPKGATSAKDRVLAVVEELSRRTGKKLPQPVVFTGDLAEEDLGLDDFALEWFQGNCKQVLHNAASIRFHCDGDRTKDPWLSNYTGTCNVVELCRQAGIDTFHHVSTAYVCGTRRDTVYETELECGQEFANDYQEAKLHAEKHIREQEFLKSKTFYRPGIVVGDSRDGFTTAPDFGLYHYIEFNWNIAKTLRSVSDPTGPLHLPFRLQMTGEERRNLVTVDWIADAIVHIMTRPEHHNQTYHLTPETPVYTRQVIKAISDYFQFEGIECIGNEPLDVSEQSDIERMFYDFASTFEEYWDDEPIYDRSNTNRVLNDVLPTPVVDEACLKMLIDYPVKNCYETRAESA